MEKDIQIERERKKERRHPKTQKAWRLTLASYNHSEEVKNALSLFIMKKEMLLIT